MVSKGYGWDRISEECQGRVSHQAIAEAMDLAHEALMEDGGRTVQRSSLSKRSICSCLITWTM